MSIDPQVMNVEPGAPAESSGEELDPLSMRTIPARARGAEGSPGSMDAREQHRLEIDVEPLSVRLVTAFTSSSVSVSTRQWSEPLAEIDVESAGPASVAIPGRATPPAPALQQMDGGPDMEPTSAGPASVAIPGWRRPSDGSPGGAPSVGSRGPDLADGPMSLRHPIHLVVPPPVTHEDGDWGYVIRSGDGGVTVIFEGLDLPPAAVTRMGPHALRIQANPAVELSPDAMVRVHLRWPGEQLGPILARVSPAARSDRAPELVLGFVQPLAELAGQVLAVALELAGRGLAEPAGQPAPQQQEIKDPAQIRQIVVALGALANDGTLRSGRDLMRVRIQRVDAEAGQILWELSGIGDGWRETPYVIEIVSYWSVYRLHFASGVLQGGLLSTPLPARVQRVRQRWVWRPVLYGGEPIAVRFSHPLWPERPPVLREIRDLSYAAIAFVVDVSSDLVFPGLELPEIFVQAPDGASVRLSAEVQTVLPPCGDAQALCWMSVKPASEEDRLAWVDLVARRLYPYTRTSDQHLEQLWSLFEASGYFNLAGKSAQDFEGLKRHFLDLGTRGAVLPELICQVVWPSESRVEASSSVLKAYQTAWMAHQLAKRLRRSDVRKGADRVLRDTYLRIFEHPQVDPEFQWMVAYVEPEVLWIRRAHLEFTKRYAGSDDLLSTIIRMMSVSCAEVVEPAPRGVEIGPPSEEDRALLLRTLQQRWPRPYLEALDFTDERLEMRRAAAAWRRAGLERERHILVARRGREPLAAMILELGQLGSNLFCLLDLARLVRLADDADLARVLLIDEARRWFRSRGRQTFNLLHEAPDEDAGYLEAARAREVSRPCLWVISSRMIPDFLQHVCELTVNRRSRA